MDLEAQIKPHSNDLPHQIVIDTLRFANCAPTQKETSCLYYSKLLRRVWKFSETDKIPNFDHLNESHALKDKEIISYITIFPLFWVQTKLIEFPCLTPVQWFVMDRDAYLFRLTQLHEIPEHIRITAEKNEENSNFY